LRFYTKLYVFLFCVINCFFVFYLHLKTEELKAAINIPIEKKIGQMVMIGFQGTSIERDGNGRLRSLVEQIKNEEIGGVILYSRNIKNKNQLQRLTKNLSSLSASYPLFISIDQEGGQVSRLKKKQGFKRFPSAKKVAGMNIDDASILYKDMAFMLKDVGINLNFAPVVDLDINSNSLAIGKVGRSYSKEPNKVAMYAKALILAHSSAKVVTVIKHFPGHGSAADDTHLGFVDVTNSWLEEELEPYRLLIKENFVDMVMSSHVFQANIDDVYPASLSVEHIENLLRFDIGYDGVVITDDLQMGAISKFYDLKEIVIQSINAGNDILLFSNSFKLDKDLPKKVRAIISNAIDTGELDEEQISRSFARILRLKRKYLHE
jgi:beta-N-acetylhexosaminidase